MFTINRVFEHQPQAVYVSPTERIWRKQRKSRRYTYMRGLRFGLSIVASGIGMWVFFVLMLSLDAWF